ncbi:MAG: lycopene cyclase domain-containing protein [Promethearchaeota archaeon]
MQYFLFLFLFVFIPIALLIVLHWLDIRRKIPIPEEIRGISPWIVLIVMVIIAVIWTTPWDNYLVATGVWSYDPSLVTGVTLGWVPIEEYTFFVVQTIMTGLLLLWMARHMVLSSDTFQNKLFLRIGSFIALVPIWIVSLIGFLDIGTLVAITGKSPGAYLSLIICWLIPPIMIQLIFGADILWHYRRLVVPAILIPTIYLSAADIVAIFQGTWHISLTFSTGIFVLDLPIEEGIFFFVTNTLIVFGIILGIASESRARLEQIINRLYRSDKI